MIRYDLDHQCEPPENDDALPLWMHHTDPSAARWRCPDCKSRWVWRREPLAWSACWNRSTRSSWRWRRRNHRRINAENPEREQLGRKA